MEKVLITGATGLLGARLSPLLRRKGYLTITHGLRSDADLNFDLRDLNATTDYLDDLKPDVIINLVALTDVDRCEEYCNEAYLSNVKTVENVVAWIKQNSDCFLIHLSTDQIYDGPGPHEELDVRLTNYYSFSKYASEIAASKVDSTIFRTNFFGNSHLPNRKSLSDWAIDSLKRGEHIKLFTDVLFTPLSIKTLCDVIEVAINQKKKGIFNLGSHEGMSKCDFILRIAEEFGLSIENIEKVESKDFHFKAYRPKDMRMNSLFFEKTFALPLPTLEEEIKLLQKDC